ncbi:UDP-N-acetylglucosamine 2-epimerase (non-hydrolyzing) [Aquimarina sp. EL_43]|uniref:non-hydrolyzing UDP-N-acetylglucosamine 2-epimerase n=1 Tax=unclassified Aquimarina TaxID=2627091 RepID=UPI0018CA5377|nr:MULTISPECIES: UDP-N-acetylglucosamine 2-epimerase (non-hydrolyzing) [unclassified Aquimarina]MBG6131715.1 UDP-N-acetylglucosamine 2-epimerase (non-hydrolyzing) [Aquimarina sp. EL_35]MBG6152176.1 UDP-N-acetylglucosamine 2-epimerase (non-hydrolyzing) [Aquimarina sp. EL_32]MBG6169880.1 UDP-N-acetylglucosamine 2-epimerase (non-hydrolyzing) [Aquimarina sp. EL_43]
MKKNLIVFGTRPEAIKMAPLVKEFQKHSDIFETRICITAQHREMLDQVLSFFEITPNYDLNLMKPNQNLYTLTADIIVGLKPILEEFKPDYVYVHGDTTTTMASSIAAFYSGAKVCHVEAGLRTFNMKSPFPEEMNRSVTGIISDVHFSPTETSRQNLINENKDSNSIIITGNTVIDALQFSVEKVNTDQFRDKEIEQLKKVVQTDKKLILVTGHRRENHGQGFINICEALKKIATDNSETQIIYPVHLNPNVQKPVYELLDKVDNIKLISPLSYPAFVWLMSQSYLIITDSGGVQEEAPSLGKPVLVMRDTTERPEAVEAGTVILVGTDKNRIISETQRLLEDKSSYENMSKLHNPYGDGRACQRIVEYISKN